VTLKSRWLLFPEGRQVLFSRFLIPPDQWAPHPGKRDHECVPGPSPTHCSNLVLMRNRTRKLLLFLCRRHSCGSWICGTGRGNPGLPFFPTQLPRVSSCSHLWGRTGSLCFVCRRQPPDTSPVCPHPLPAPCTHWVRPNTARSNSAQAESHLVGGKKRGGGDMRDSSRDPPNHPIYSNRT
jgi:hypothetical protein